MASPRRPSPYVHPDQEEPVQERAAAEYAKRRGWAAKLPPDRLCRHCGVSLMTGAEWRLGIHIWCVHNLNQTVAAASIPRPRYGRH